ncbi:cyclopropane-fatty-acyl-phospholipid synthase family protein [Acidisphaera sp. L21]|uniref:SAM-dependent methyltransferase n=1 Tax=Acidisphaera sp. L21 TaxID=1641851 RepID=UPI0020B11ED5|nr:cyclopropane-fatty-acyl-phospholipid synthase family protein [Acidisphaera sp. L21]
MNFISLGTAAVERLPLPDPITRRGVSFLVGRTARRMSQQPNFDSQFASDMDAHPIAIHTDDANAQHYELPPEFFELALGAHRKYSSCLYANDSDTLEMAEAHALAETCAHAGLANGQRILELGCGWGSLSLWMAEHYPDAQITAVSNSRTQRATIERLATERSLRNLTVITADMNNFQPNEMFDRVVSVEMFEHMANWTALLTNIRRWLTPAGRLFLHVFTHRAAPYRFDHADPSDWIAQHFFTGGLMPSHGLIRCFPLLFEVENEWRWSGTHYARTAMHWLENFDRHQARIGEILGDAYGPDAPLWRRRWRLFFLATAGLFGHDQGREWGVSHYRLRPI